MFGLLTAFNERTDYGVLSNTSLHFNGVGRINAMSDLDQFTYKRKLYGLAVEGRAYLLKNSPGYQAYQRLAAPS